MDSKPATPSVDTDNEINSLVNAFKEKLKIKDEEKQKERAECRADRKIRREKGEEYVSSDTEDEFDGKSEDVVVKLKAKKEAALNDKLIKNAKECFTYQKLVEGFKQKKFKKVAVVTGAGISVAAGIPDFRSPKTGLYANLGQYNLPSPESMFELAYFQKKPQAFYHLAKEFLDLRKYMPTPTHHFINLLDQEGIL